MLSESPQANGGRFRAYRLHRGGHLEVGFDRVRPGVTLRVLRAPHRPSSKLAPSTPQEQSETSQISASESLQADGVLLHNTFGQSRRPLYTWYTTVVLVWGTLDGFLSPGWRAQAGALRLNSTRGPSGAWDGAINVEQVHTYTGTSSPLGWVG